MAVLAKRPKYNRMASQRVRMWCPTVLTVNYRACNPEVLGSSLAIRTEVCMRGSSEPYQSTCERC